jgi:hypothetical protein
MHLEANPEEIESEAEHEEVHKEEGTVETIGALKSNMGTGTRTMVGPGRS